MPQVIVVFLLFFAVLAFAWFYFQRAKARPDTTTVGQATSDQGASAPGDRAE